MDPVFLISMLVGTVIPVLNGIVTKYTAVRARVFLQLILNAANGLLVEALAGGEGFNWTVAGLAALLSLIVAISTQAGVWKPLGISAAAKSFGSSAPRPAPVSPADER